MVRRGPSGWLAWIVQRASAVYMLAFLVAGLAWFMADPPGTYPAWRARMAGAGTGIATAAFFAALLAHAWVGLRDVVLDYVRPRSLCAPVLVGLGLGLAAVAAWVLRILVTVRA